MSLNSGNSAFTEVPKKDPKAVFSGETNGQNTPTLAKMGDDLVQFNGTKLP